MKKSMRNFFGTAALAVLICLAGLVVAGAARADFSCDVCIWVITEVQNPLTEESTLEETTRSVDGVCGRMPEFLREPCGEFISEYRYAIIHYCLQGDSPAEICGSRMGRCP